MESHQTSLPANKYRFIGIFLLSFSTLLLEISLTRVLSVALWYHFGFLVISTALLGFGASGTVLTIWNNLREKISLDKAMTWICILFSISTLFSFWLMQHIPFAPFSLLTDSSQLLFMPLYFMVIALPFFFSGLGISLLLTRGAKDVNHYYAWDLAGAALGCIAVIIVLPFVGGSGAIFVAAASGAFSAIPFTLLDNRRNSILAAGLSILIFIGAFFGDHIIPIHVTSNKGSWLKDQVPIASGWNSFSKVDLYERPADPENNRFSSQFFIIDRGTAATGLSDVRPYLDSLQIGIPAKHPMNQRESGISILGKKEPHVLVIGSGAGADVYTALEYGASKVTAIDINPLINDEIATNPFFKPLFDLPEVELVTDEGRSFVKRSNEQYDAIVSTHTITNAAMASGALSLSESYILTTEAFEDYMDHLKEDGILFFTRPEYQIARLFTTAKEVLKSKGIDEPSLHLYAYRFAEPGDSSLTFSAGFMMKKKPFTKDEVIAIDKSLADMSEGDAVVQLLYSPLSKSTDSPLEFSPNQEGIAIYGEICSTQDLKTFYLTRPEELAPATDNKPFFNHRTRWSSINLSMISDIFKQEKRGRMALEDRPISGVTLLVLLIQTALIACFLILLPLFKLPKESKPFIKGLPFILYFSGLGLGFILIEIVFLQKFTLYLGQPVYTFAGVLAGLLLFTGVGAYWGNRFKDNPGSALKRIILLLLGVLIILTLITPFIFNLTLSLPIGLRIVIAEILIAPIGVLMGMPFPLGLRMVNGKIPALVPWAWGVNGFFTVIGSILSVILGMAFGFYIVIAIAGMFYLLCWLILPRMEKR